MTLALALTEMTMTFFCEVSDVESEASLDLLMPNVDQRFLPWGPRRVVLTIVLSHFFLGWWRVLCWEAEYISFIFCPDSGPTHARVMTCGGHDLLTNHGKVKRKPAKKIFLLVYQNGLQFAADIKLPISRTKQWQCTPNEKKPHGC